MDTAIFILLLLAVILLGAEAARTRSLGWAGLCLWALTELLSSPRLGGVG
jgi:hypothetical protein